MKLSVEVQNQHNHHQQSRHDAEHQLPFHLRAKIPITVFNLPFLSGFSTTAYDPSNLSLSLATNFSSGPSLKLSYKTTTTTASSTSSTPTPPLTLTLRSGVGLFGSPNNSPLIISVNFSFSPQNPYPNPTFSLHFRPRLGDFSFRKTTFSNPNPNPNPKAKGEANSFVFVPLDSNVTWKGLTLDSSSNKDSIFSGFAVMANTAMPMTKKVALNFRWGLNFPADVGKQMPFLSVNKIGIERVNQAKDVKEVKEKSKEGNGGDLEMLKGMHFWMKRELDSLQRENREMKNAFDEMKLGRSLKHRRSNDDWVGRNSAPVVENSDGFEQWRSKKNGGDEKGLKEMKKNGNRPSDLENELQKAIKAASS